MVASGMMCIATRHRLDLGQPVVEQVGYVARDSWIPGDDPVGGRYTSGRHDDSR
jgi:hypothetical protein